MSYQSENHDTFLKGVFSETLWETLVTLGVAAAICISLIGLSAHLSQAKAVPPAVTHSIAGAVAHQQ